MSHNNRSIVRTPLVALLGVALALPLILGASGVQSAAANVLASSTSDNDISGAVNLPSSPVYNRLDTVNDGDVFKVYLSAGQRFTARLNVTPASEFDLFLYAPDAVSVNDPTAPVMAETFDWYYPRFLSNSANESFGYVAPKSGTYFLEVYSTTGTGAYSLEWAKGSTPSLSISSSSYINRGATKRFAGTLRRGDSKPLAAQVMELYAQPYGQDDFKRVSSTLTASDGTYAFSVKPTVHTYYKVVALTKVSGYAFVQSVVRQVKVRTSLSKPKAPSSVYKGRKFRVYGYMLPKHKSGDYTVYIKAYRKEKQSNGTYKYVYRKSFRMTNYNNATKYPKYTKYYSRTVYLPYKGTWRLRAKAPDDGKHATSYGGYTYLRVR